jgi:hypothetical protein
MLALSGARAELTPLVRHDFKSPDGISFSAACFQGPGNEWSLAPLQQPQDVEANPVLSHKIRSAMRNLGADRIYAPSPVKFNGEIVLNEHLNKILDLGHKVLLFRNKDVPADGTFLRSSRDAGIFSAGGCGVIVATLGEHMIFAHAGRECVIDRGRVITGTASRYMESVTDYVVRALLEVAGDFVEIRNLYAWMLYSIRPEDFLHPYDDEKHGEYNLRVGQYIVKNFGAGVRFTDKGAELDIPAIVKSQFQQHGVPEENISLKHAYISDELPTTRSGGGRYLVSVVRH